MSRILVAYYSRSGNTKHVAEQLAHSLGADVEVIVDHVGRTGALGYLRSTFDGALRHYADIAASTHDPSDYQVVLVGSPVWNRSISSPVRAYLARHSRELPAVGFFCTYGGYGVRQAIDHMIELSGKHPIWTLAVRDSEVKRGYDVSTIQAAARRLSQPSPALAVM
jgi:hypothetical protein